MANDSYISEFTPIGIKFNLIVRNNINGFNTGSRSNLVQFGTSSKHPKYMWKNFTENKDQPNSKGG